MWFKMVGSCGWINAGSGREKKRNVQLRIHQHCKERYIKILVCFVSLFFFLSVSVNDHPAGSVSPAFCNSSTFIITTPTGLQGSNKRNKTPDTMDHRKPGGIKKQHLFIRYLWQRNTDGDVPEAGDTALKTAVMLLQLVTGCRRDTERWGHHPYVHLGPLFSDSSVVGNKLK